MKGENTAQLQYWGYVETKGGGNLRSGGKRCGEKRENQKGASKTG